MTEIYETIPYAELQVLLGDAGTLPVVHRDMVAEHPRITAYLPSDVPRIWARELYERMDRHFPACKVRLVLVEDVPRADVWPWWLSEQGMPL
jgi:hypothetical protein